MELNVGTDLGQFDVKDLGNGGGQSLDAAYGGFPRIGATGSVDYRVCLARFKPESLVNCLPCGHLFHSTAARAVYFGAALLTSALQFLAVCLGFRFWTLKAEVEAQTNTA
jgi:hypothetical protein